MKSAEEKKLNLKSKYILSIIFLILAMIVSAVLISINIRDNRNKSNEIRIHTENGELPGSENSENRLNSAGNKSENKKDNSDEGKNADDEDSKKDIDATDNIGAVADHVNNNNQNTNNEYNNNSIDNDTINNTNSDINTSGNDTLDNTSSEDNVARSIHSGEYGTATVVMVGDVLLHTPVSDSGLMADGTYNYDHLFANVRSDISAADLALVNQEVILGGRELGLSGYPTFNGAYEVGDALVRAGFDVVLHATNHALDKGRTGILNCLQYWRTSHPEIGVIGINDSYEMQNHIYTIAVNGIRIAILNYTYGTNGISMPSDMPYAVNLIDRDKMAHDIQMARAVSDFIIVCPHWGIEYTHSQNSDQTSLAVFLAEQGTDLILGAHPHVIQPIEWVEASNGNRALVYYSLGNFINATSEYGSGVADRMVGAMSNVTITMNQETGRAEISDYDVVPLVTHMLTGSGRITTYRLSDYNQELASQNEVLERDTAFSYDYCIRLCENVFGNILR